MDTKVKFNHQSTPGFAIARTSHLLWSAFRSTLREVGWDIPPEETQAMIALSDADGPLSMREFAELMMRDATTLKRQLDGLVERGFVRRVTSQQDGRVVMVSLTARGQDELNAVLPVIEELRRRVLAGISQSDIEATLRTLHAMLRNLKLERPS